MKITNNDELCNAIAAGYEDNTWCKKLLLNHAEMPGVEQKGDLLFFEDRLVIPCCGNVRQTIFALAHNTLGHFGFDKSYEVLHHSFYWPGIRTDLEKSYVLSCEQCQHFKSATTKPIGPLHPLPIPDHHFESVAMDFVGELPEEDSYNMIMTIIDRLGADIRLIPTTKDALVENIAKLFFNHWYCENGLLLEIISN